MAEHNRLEQVFISLVNNAIDAIERCDQMAGKEYEKLISVRSYIEEKMVVANPTANTARVGTLGAMVMMATVLFYVIWSYREYRRKWISRIEADDLLVKGKHRDLVVDVAKLPEIKDDEATIELDSLEELVKVAESLLKPVLRLAEKERHIYCVMDGETRYQYTSELEYISYYKHIKLSQTEESGEK